MTIVIFSETNENMQKGLALYKVDRFEDSLYFFNSVIESSDTLKFEAMFWKSKSLYQLQLFNESKRVIEDFFRQGAVNSSYYEDARFLYCKIYFKLEAYRDAMLLFNQYLRNSSFQYYKTSARFWLAECYLQLSMYGEAKKTYKEYLELKPSSRVAVARIELIDNMLTLLTDEKTNDIDIYEKSQWLNDYIIMEQTEGNSTYVSDFLNSFSTREEFFSWLELFSKPVIEEKEEVEVTDTLLLDDLENKLLKILEVSDE